MIYSSLTNFNKHGTRTFIKPLNFVSVKFSMKYFLVLVSTSVTGLAVACNDGWIWFSPLSIREEMCKYPIIHINIYHAILTRTITSRHLTSFLASATLHYSGRNYRTPRPNTNSGLQFLYVAGNYSGELNFFSSNGEFKCTYVWLLNR